MATTALKGSGYTNMEAAVDALQAATNSLTLGADTYMGVEKVGAGNWAYWCIHDN